MPAAQPSISPTPGITPGIAPGIARTLARHPRPLGGDTARSVGIPLVSLTGMVLNNNGAASQHSIVNGQRRAGSSSSPAPADPQMTQIDRHEKTPAHASMTQNLALRRKPDWLRARMPGGAGYERLKSIIDEHQLHTVCQEASCPNMGECWSRGTATIMILGDTCTRSCGFCNVKTGRPLPADPDEPRRVAESLRLMNLKHVVITCVDRDDLKDGGAAIWAETIRRVHEMCTQTSVEALIGDFKGDADDVQVVIEARPEILAHNLETVKRMHPAVRPQADYQRSLRVLRQIKQNGLVSKSGIMVGIGEKDDEVLAVMNDVRGFADTDIFTIGQYLQPTRNHLPIDRWVTPEQFLIYKCEGLSRGFKVVESGPLVRSSYHAEEQAERLSPERRETAAMMEQLLAEARSAAC